MFLPPTSQRQNPWFDVGLVISLVEEGEKLKHLFLRALEIMPNKLQTKGRNGIRVGEIARTTRGYSSITLVKYFSDLDMWIKSWKLGVQFLFCIPEEPTCVAFSKGHSPRSPTKEGNRKPFQSTLYPENMEKGCHNS